MKKLIVPALCLGLVGCTQSQIVTDLDIAAAAIAAVSVVPGIPAIDVTYLSAVDKSLDCTISAVQTGGTPSQLAFAISACGLTTISTVVPSGTPTTIVNLITAVITAVQKVIADIPAPTTSNVTAGTKSMKWSSGDLKKLAKTHQSLQNSLVKLNAGGK